MTMATKDISNGLKARLEGGGLSPTISYPNVDTPIATRPRIEVMYGEAGREDPSLKGGQVQREVGLFVCIVCTEIDIGEDGANDFADAIAALFPKGTQIAITGGTITMRAAPTVFKGHRDGPDWKVKVEIPYVAVAT